VDPRAGLDDMERRKYLPPPGLELRHVVVQPVASRYTDCAIPALQNEKIPFKILMLFISLRETFHIAHRAEIISDE
jgi:hypothetical protein